MFSNQNSQHVSKGKGVIDECTKINVIMICDYFDNLLNFCLVP